MGEKKSFCTDSRNVTVIVPIHNSEKYLRDCLSSALAQTLKEIEILCIDSSSTDLCFDIISELQRSDDRIVYLKDPNTGYGHKINVGIEAANGDYIAILETDDQMAPDMVEKLYNVAETYRVDVADGDFYRFFSYEGKQLYQIGRKYPNPDIYNQRIDNENTSSRAVAMDGIWTALYRRSFLIENDIRLNESAGASYQDMSFLFLTGLLAASTYHLDIPLYWYRVDNIGSSVKDDRKIFEIIGECEFLKRELERRNLHNQNTWVLYYIRKYDAFYWNYCRLSDKSRKLFFTRYVDELKTDFESGAINREMFDETMYNRTFLLLDAPKKFMDLVIEADQHKSMGAICEILDRLENRKIILFGAGKLGNKVIDILIQNQTTILGVCDNAASLHGTVINGYEVRPVFETVRKFPDASYLIVSRNYGEEMKAQLLNEGIAETNIEIFT